MSVGENLKRIREARGLTKYELALRTGGVVSQSTIAAIEVRKSQRSRFTPELAKALDVSVDDLLGIKRSDELGKEVEPGPEHLMEDPLISWVQAGNWSGNNTDVEVEAWIPTPKHMSKGSFALRVVGESMYPILHQGDIIFVDPIVAQDPGRIVIAMRGEETTVKRLVKADGIFYLKAENEDWPGPRFLEIDDEVRIVGVVTGKYIDL